MVKIRMNHQATKPQKMKIKLFASFAASGLGGGLNYV
jgi:hypothetical protein